jgi:hypothetical protein
VAFRPSSAASKRMSALSALSAFNRAQKGIKPWVRAACVSEPILYQAAGVSILDDFPRRLTWPSPPAGNADCAECGVSIYQQAERIGGISVSVTRTSSPS